MAQVICSSRKVKLKSLTDRNTGLGRDVRHLTITCPLQRREVLDVNDGVGVGGGITDAWPEGTGAPR